MNCGRRLGCGLLVLLNVMDLVRRVLGLVFSCSLADQILVCRCSA